MAGPHTIETGDAPIKAWIDGVPIEDAARRQLCNLSGTALCAGHVAALFGVHFGKGAAVGSVIATKAAIVPAAVGVDIGCGMVAVRTTLTSAALPHSLERLRLGIEAALPHGGVGLKGGWKDGVPNAVARRFRASGLGEALHALEAKHPAIRQAQSHDGVDVLIGHRRFIDHACVLAALDAGAAACSASEKRRFASPRDIARPAPWAQD